MVVSMTFTVSCSNWFSCIEGRCSDPSDALKMVKRLHRCPVKSCSACHFSDDFSLDCEGFTGLLLHLASAKRFT